MNAENGIAIWRKLQAAEAAVRGAFAEIMPENLAGYTVAQIHCITAVYRLTASGYPEGLKLKELAEKLNVTAAAASEMVETLVHKGALIRRKSEADRRAVLLKLAPELERQFRQCNSLVEELFQAFYNQLPEEKARLLDTFSDDFLNFTQEYLCQRQKRD